jgi:hypothetical protein
MSNGATQPLYLFSVEMVYCFKPITKIRQAPLTAENILNSWPELDYEDESNFYYEEESNF